MYKYVYHACLPFAIWYRHLKKTIGFNNIFNYMLGHCSTNTLLRPEQNRWHVAVIFKYLKQWQWSSMTPCGINRPKWDKMQWGNVHLLGGLISYIRLPALQGNYTFGRMLFQHNDVMKWTHIPHHCPFVRRIQRLTRTKARNAELVFFVCLFVCLFS